MVKGRLVGIIGYVTRSTEYNFPLHEVILELKENREFTFVSSIISNLSFYTAGASFYHFNLWYIHVYNEMENYFLVKVAFGDEIEAVQKEAKSLREQSVEIIIALGHSGYDIDQVGWSAFSKECFFF